MLLINLLNIQTIYDYYLHAFVRINYMRSSLLKLDKKEQKKMKIQKESLPHLKLCLLLSY